MLWQSTPVTFLLLTKEYLLVRGEPMSCALEGGCIFILLRFARAGRTDFQTMFEALNRFYITLTGHAQMVPHFLAPDICSENPANMLKTRSGLGPLVDHSERSRRARERSNKHSTDTTVNNTGLPMKSHLHKHRDYQEGYHE